MKLARGFCISEQLPLHTGIKGRQVHPLIRFYGEEPRTSGRVGNRCTVTALSTWGLPAYPLAAPPSRVVRMEEMDERLLAVKGDIHDFVSSSCTSGKKGTGAERGCEPRPAPRNQSSSREGSGLGGLLTSSPIQAIQASMAISSGSGPVRVRCDILSTDGTPNEMLCAPWDGAAESPGNQTGCSMREE